MKKVCVCHCKYYEISDDMIINCGDAWKEANDGSKVEEEEIQDETIVDDGDEKKVVDDGDEEKGNKSSRGN